MPRISDRTVLITGGTGALGGAVVQAFVETGADVHVSWIVEREADGLRVALGKSAERVRLHQANVTDPASVETVVNAVGSSRGRLDVLVQLVGGFTFGPIGETDAASWQKMLALNATSTFLCARAAAGWMRRARWGRIIAVAAVPAVDRGAANMSAYAASKAATLNLVQSLSKELVGDGITCNAIAPTIIDTPANRASMPKADTATWLPPRAIAEVVTWLASDAAGIVTGTTVMLSRG